MNTVQIANHFRKLDDETKELRKILDLLNQEGYGGSKAYAILDRAWEEKQKEYNIFAKKEWIDEKQPYLDLNEVRK